MGNGNTRAAGVDELETVSIARHVGDNAYMSRAFRCSSSAEKHEVAFPKPADAIDGLTFAKLHLRSALDRDVLFAVNEPCKSGAVEAFWTVLTFAVPCPDIAHGFFNNTFTCRHYGRYHAVGNNAVGVAQRSVGGNAIAYGNGAPEWRCLKEQHKKQCRYFDFQ